MQSIIEIINSIGTPMPNVNPTVFYNEGWITRLLVLSSIQEKIKLGNVDFSCINNWTSEALISSPFINAQNHREGYTHADIAVGDFKVDYSKRGKIIVNDDAILFGIIEAKMGSNLSKGTTHAKEYNQANRNLVCIANNTTNQPECKTFFYVVAPESKLKKYKMEVQISLESVLEQVKNRFNLHETEELIFSQRQQIMEKIENTEIKALSYEDWIKQFKNGDIQHLLQNFYDKANKWNRIK